MSEQGDYFPFDDQHVLCYQCYGAKEGKPVFYFHGFPGSRLECAILDEAALKLDMRIIAVDRPGYGGSTPQPGRTLASWAEQVGGLADHLGLQQFGIIGVSGGGPYALACARYLAPRLTAVTDVCGLGPINQTGLAEIMHWIARNGFDLARKDSWLLKLPFGGMFSLMSTLTPRAMIQTMARLNREPDKGVLLRPNVIEVLARSIGASFAQGRKGMDDDLAIYVKDWGFDLSELSFPVQLWHGDNDRIVPLAHSQYLHERLRG